MIRLRPIHKTDPNNKFRNSLNKLYGKELFVEFNTVPGVALYTLQKHDYLGCLSLYRLYIEMADLSEYDFANKYFDGWKHWEMLSAAGWLKPYIEEWRQELEVKIKARAIANVIAISNSDGKDKLSASKYIAERGWEKKTTRRVGRPEKEPDVLTDAQKIYEEELLEEDAKRVLSGELN